MFVRISRALAAVLTALLAIFSAGQALACSVIDSYVMPSNFELVQLADAIVIAEAVSLEPEEEGSEWGSVTFRTISTLKGEAPETFSAGYGLGDPAPSNPLSLSEANPDAYGGSCTRGVFRQGDRYVIFLGQREGGGWSELGFPWTRVNEDYFGEDSLWVSVIRAYVDIQERYEPMAEIDALIELHASYAASADPMAAGRAADIEHHLGSISPYKPTAFLVDAFERLERGEALAAPLSNRNAASEEGDIDALAEALLGLPPSENPREADPTYVVLEALVEGDHPDATSLFERLVAQPDLGAARFALAVRFLAKNGQYRRAYDLIERDGLRRVLTAERADGGLLLNGIYQAVNGENYEEPMWESDPYVAEHWPELAFGLYRYWSGVYGRDSSGIDHALFERLNGDWRERPDLALAKAANLNSEAEAWAIEQLSSPASDEVFDRRSENPDWLPLQMLALSYGDERDAAMERIFCAGGERRALLIQALGIHGDDMDIHTVLWFGAANTLSEDEKATLMRALAGLAADRGYGGSGWAADDAMAGIAALARGEQPELEGEPPCQ